MKKLIYVGIGLGALGLFLASRGSKASGKGSPYISVDIVTPIPIPEDPDEGDVCNPAPGVLGTLENGECVPFWDEEIKQIMAEHLLQVYEDKGKPIKACNIFEIYDPETNSSQYEYEPIAGKIVRIALQNAYPELTFPPNDTSHWQHHVWTRTWSVYSEVICGLPSSF